MKKIKAIQTEYKGYLFRSRLEARWAVFSISVVLNMSMNLKAMILEMV